MGGEVGNRDKPAESNRALVKLPLATPFWASARLSLFHPRTIGGIQRVTEAKLFREPLDLQTRSRSPSPSTYSSP